MSVLKDFGRLWHQFKLQGLRLTLLAGFDKLLRLFNGFSPWRFTRITKEIVLGGQPAKHVLSKLAKGGVTGIVNMRAEYDYSDEVGRANLNYIYLPTVDNTAPTLEHLLDGVEFICEEIEKGGSVYIHCWEGLGRGPTMAAAFFVKQGLTPEQAWDKIRKVRPFIRPTKEQSKRLDEVCEYYNYPEPTDLSVLVDVQDIEDEQV